MDFFNFLFGNNNYVVVKCKKCHRRVFAYSISKKQGDSIGYKIRIHSRGFLKGICSASNKIIGLDRASHSIFYNNSKHKKHRSKHH